jgi:hypothetical protein
MCGYVFFFFFFSVPCSSLKINTPGSLQVTKTITINACKPRKRTVGRGEKFAHVNRRLEPRDKGVRAELLADLPRIALVKVRHQHRRTGRLRQLVAGNPDVGCGMCVIVCLCACVCERESLGGGGRRAGFGLCFFL